MVTEMPQKRSSNSLIMSTERFSNMKKIHFVFAPVFMYWPVAFVQELQRLRDEKLLIGGFIGGPKEYYEKLSEEIKDNYDDLVYTHDLEKEWIEKEASAEKTQFFIELLGSDELNELVISDRHLGFGFVSGGGLHNSQMLTFLKDNKESYRNYIINMLDFLHTKLGENKPDILISYAVAGSFTLAIFKLCKILGIPFFKISHTRIDNRVVLDSNAIDVLDRVKEVFFKDVTDKENQKFAIEYLNSFRKAQKQPKYQIGQNNVYLQKTRLSHRAKLWVKLLIGTLSTKREFYHTSYKGLVQYEMDVAKGIKQFWKRKPYYNHKDLINKKFFYYPLHVDPEASTMVFSPHQTNQMAVIEAIAKSKPFDHILLVKEHLTMIGRRPSGFYDRVNAMPGVYMVNPLEPSFLFIKDSAAIITLTGTTGLEALLLKKPAVFLGNFTYKFIKKGFVLHTDLSSLKDVLNSIEEIPAVSDDVLIKLLASIHSVSFPFDASLIWSGVSKEKVLNNKDTVAIFANELNKIMPAYD